MRRLSMKKIKDVLKLRYITEISFRQISRALNIPSSTVSDYCKRFEITNCAIDEFLKIDEDEIYTLLFPEKRKIDTPSKRPLPNFESIYKEISKKGVTFELLWMEYKEQHPDGYGLSRFKELYYEFKNKVSPTMRQTYIPGHQMFVDYSGLNVPYHDTQTGQIHKAQIFVAVLGGSGCAFVHATPSQKQEHFIKSHILAHTEPTDWVIHINTPENASIDHERMKNDGVGQEI